MTNDRRYLIGLAPSTIPPGERHRFETTIDNIAGKYLRPLRLHLATRAEQTLAGCTVSSTIAGRRVATDLDAARFTVLQPDDGRRLNDVSDWPSFGLSTPIVLEVTNPHDAAITITPVLLVAVEEYRRLEHTTPVVEPGQTRTVVLTVPTLAKLLRFECETDDMWNPAGWTITALFVGPKPLLLAEITTQLLTALHGPAGIGLCTFVVQAGQQLTITVRRDPGQPAAALTLRAILDEYHTPPKE